MSAADRERLPRVPLEYRGARDGRGAAARRRGRRGRRLGRARRRCASPRARSAAGLVLEVHRDLAVVQVLEGTAGIDPDTVSVAFEGRPLEIPVGEGWLGRVWNGMGEPLDGGPPMLGDAAPPGGRLAAQPDRARRARATRS